MSAAAADSLTVKSRDFYERAKFKQVLSIVLAATGLMALGFCSSYGGLSNSNTILANREDDLVIIVDDDLFYVAVHMGYDKIYSAMSTGFGFGAFFFILAVIFFWTAAIYIGPASCGSANEKMMMKSPQEPEAKSAV
jgi:hypothetical protein